MNREYTSDERSAAMMSGPAGEAEDTSVGRGTRRKRFAGYIRAANELRQSYQKSSNEHHPPRRGPDDPDELGIPGAFPEVHVARGGNEELILFPSYARRHTKKSKSLRSYPSVSGKGQEGSGDAEYWRKEWEEYEDANAVVDVDVRGWIYAPHRGPLNRKNRLVLGIARQLSGIPAPPAEAENEHKHLSDKHVERVAEQQAQEISEHGEREARFARQGGYGNGTSLSDRESSAPSSRYPSPRPGDFPHPNTSQSLQEGSSATNKRKSWAQPANMSREELAVANAHLLRRLQPFFATASTNVALTIFYFNDETSQSRTTITNDSGQFNFRAALNFVPTQVRVLASENLSASADVLITESKGISLISDVDDTIKHSAIGGGAREIFRNAFIRDFGDLIIEGVQDWYDKLGDLGVKFHYLSNSPWQMYPLLVSYFARAGLPAGSFHLKQYSGMLQGIFEPVAERKKGTMNRIMNDFPERRFIMVGDSGEADLELYVETALQYPGRILAIYIRDVTTSPSKISYEATSQFFTSSRGSSPAGTSPRNSNSPYSASPQLPARTMTEPPSADEEDLIDFSDDISPETPNSLTRTMTNGSIASYKTAPPRPSKPARLRSSSSATVPQSDALSPPSIPDAPKSAPYRPSPPSPNPQSRSPPPPVPLKRSTLTYHLKPPNRYSHVPPPRADADNADRPGYRAAVRKRVAGAYNLLPSPAAYLAGTSSRSASPVRSADATVGSLDGTLGGGGGGGGEPRAPRSATRAPPSPDKRPVPPLPPRRALSAYPVAAAQYAGAKLWSGGGGSGSGSTYGEQGMLGSVVGSAGGGGGGGAAQGMTAGSKKEGLWRQRLARARAMLQGRSVVLRVWRVGQDLMDESVALVQRAQLDD